MISVARLCLISEIVKFDPMSATAQHFGLASDAYYVTVTYFAQVKRFMLVLC